MNVHLHLGWIVGVLLAALSAFISNLGVTLQKLHHLRVSNKSQEVRSAYYRHHLWQIGLGLIIFGALADFSALSFAPQSLIAPLASLNLVCNVIFAPLLLKERVTTHDVVATVIIIIGSSVSVGFANHTDVVYGTNELFAAFTQLPFAIYFSIVILLISLLYFLIQYVEEIELEHRLHSQSSFLSASHHKLLKYQRFAYPAISGIAGAQSVLFAKCTVELLANSFHGRGFLFAHWQTFAVIAALATSIVCQIKWLNDGLRRFPACYTIPVFTSFWILVSVIAGLVFYNEYAGMSGSQFAMFVCGIFITISGVIALSHLPHDDQADTKHSVLNTEASDYGSINGSGGFEFEHDPLALQPRGAVPAFSSSLHIPRSFTPQFGVITIPAASFSQRAPPASAVPLLSHSFPPRSLAKL